MEYESSKLPRHRISVLLGLILAVLFAYLAVMFDIQIVNGEEYRARSMAQIVRSTTVEAARGNITDRNGRLIVGNRQTYTLTFDASLLPEGTDQNKAILRLVNLCIENGIAYTDGIPLSQSAPFVYTYEDLTTNESNRFNSYLKKFKESLSASYEKRQTRLAAIEEAKNSGKKNVKELTPDPFLDQPNLNIENMSAEQLLDALRWEYDIDPSYSDEDARKIIAVRYELAYRVYWATTAYVLADDVDIGLITLVKDGDYYGADIGLSSSRQYETTAAAHILGHLGSIEQEEYQQLKNEGYSYNAKIGRDGVEAAFETYLHGINGTRIVSTNDDGKITSELYAVEPEPGDIVELTLDIDFQEEVELLLAQKVEEMTAKDGIARGGAAAVVDIHDGGVLALASYPTYDLSAFNKNYNEYASDPLMPFYNRATDGVYIPGSTLKPLTAIAALENGSTTIYEQIRDTGRWYYPNDPTGSGASCWFRAGHGNENVTKAITDSCNYFFAEMGYRMGMSTFRDYLSSFGLGQSTGIEIGDSAGKLPENPEGQNQAPWAAFGQSNQLYSPLQLANYIATLVNGGNHYQTHLLKRVIRYDNSEIVFEAEPVLLNRVEMDPANVNAVLTGMHNLAVSGSVSGYFRDCVVDAACKTGSAQTGGTIADGVFVAYAPYDDPEIAVAVVIEKGGAGAALASTAVGILNAYFTEEEIATTIIGENQLLG